MASPQLEDGYFRIANEIWDQIMSRNFTKRQRSILDLVLRASYGCNRKSAHIPQLRYFRAAGVGKNHITQELKTLCEARVIEWHRETMLFALNKNYEQWTIRPAYDDSVELARVVVAINLAAVPKTGTGVPETGTEHEDGSQNGNSPVPETGTERFPKRELGQGQDPLPEGSEVTRKDSIKDSIKDKEHVSCQNVPDTKPPSTKTTDAYTPEFEEFWTAYPRFGSQGRKTDKRATFTCWKTRLKERPAEGQEKLTPEALIQSAHNYAAATKAERKDPQYIKHAKTFLGPSRAFEEYIALEPEESEAAAALDDDTAEILAAQRAEREELERQRCRDPARPDAFRNLARGGLTGAQARA